MCVIFSGGKGQVMSIQQLGPGFNVQMQTPCDKCGGRGKMPKHVCPVCGGTKLQMEDKKLELAIEKGMRDAQEVVFERASEQSPGKIITLCYMHSLTHSLDAVMAHLS